MGIEALSRGAGGAVFVESDSRIVEAIRQNLKRAGFSARALMYDAISFLERLEEKFDVIYIDPPYRSDLSLRALFLISTRHILHTCGVAITEEDRGKVFNGILSGISLRDRRRYGRTVLSFYRYNRYKSS